MTGDASAGDLPPFRQPKPVLRWCAFGVTVLGWALSLSLLVGATQPPGGWLDAFCGPAGSSHADCRSVLHSRWGYVQLGPDESALKIPTSALGMGYFAFVGLWYLFIGPPTRERRVYHAIVLLLVAYAAVRSVYLIWVMAFVLRQWCTGCLAAHALNFALFALTFAAWPWRPSATPMRPHPSGRLALATVTAGLLAGVLHPVVMVIVIQGGWLRQLGETYRAVVDEPAYIAWNYARQPEVTLPLRDDDVFLGPADAAHTVVVFSDFRCTACRRAHHVLSEVVRQRSDVRVVFRHFPQDPVCNAHPDFQAAGSTGACAAARAYEAARAVGGAEAARAMWQHMYERSAELERRPFAEWAAELGLDRAAFEAALESDAVRQRIADDIALADGLGICAVPVLYLDGRRLTGWNKPETWIALLRPASEAGGATR